MYTRPTISSIDYVRDEVVKTVLMHRRTQHCVGSDTSALFCDLDVCALGERSLNLVSWLRNIEFSISRNVKLGPIYASGLSAVNFEGRRLLATCTRWLCDLVSIEASSVGSRIFGLASVTPEPTTVYLSTQRSSGHSFESSGSRHCLGHVLVIDGRFL